MLCCYQNCHNLGHRCRIDPIPGISLSDNCIIIQIHQQCIGALYFPIGSWCGIHSWKFIACCKWNICRSCSCCHICVRFIRYIWFFRCVWTFRCSFHSIFPLFRSIWIYIRCYLCQHCVLFLYGFVLRILCCISCFLLSCDQSAARCQKNYHSQPHTAQYQDLFSSSFPSSLFPQLCPSLRS